MTFLLLLPAVVSFLLLGAHFLRTGSPVLVGISLAMIPLLLIRRRWVSVVVRFALIFGFIEWGFTTYAMIMRRMMTGQPFLRAAGILAAVGLLSLVAAILFRTRRLHLHYRGTIEEPTSVKAAMI